MDFLNFLGSIALVLTLIGMHLIGDKIIWCWPIFIISYVAQVFVFYKTKQWFLILNMVSLIVFSCINWFKWSAKMKILEIVENDDGSCTMECEFSQEELNMLVSHAVIDILQKQIKLHNQEANIDEQRTI